MKDFAISGRSARDNLLLLLASILHQQRKNLLPQYFLKPDDLISEAPLTGKHHDEEVVEALCLLCTLLPETYIDIGANIGMMALAVADKANRIECVEPNPLAANILRTNLALHCTNYRVHEFALGTTQGAFRLYVPKGNMGGAFIRESNSYGDAFLAAKDGFSELHQSNYSIHEVPVRSFDEFLRLVGDGGIGQAVVKIDVEGFEVQIVEAILRSYTQLFVRQAIALVFECHRKSLLVAMCETLKAYSYGLYTISVKSEPELRSRTLARLVKLFSGTRRRLAFAEFSDPGASGTNYVACPARFISEG